MMHDADAGRTQNGYIDQFLLLRCQSSLFAGLHSPGKRPVQFFESEVLAFERHQLGVRALILCSLSCRVRPEV